MSKMLLLKHRADPRCVVVRPCRIRDRIQGRLRAFALDQALARGTAPDSTAALFCRAQALLSWRARRQTGEQFQEIVGSLREPPRARSNRVPISRGLLLAAEHDLSLLAVRLLDEEPADVRGIAISGLLICDGLGPLYGRGGGAASALRATVNRAIETLEPRY
jgi:hypothetical protein